MQDPKWLTLTISAAASVVTVGITFFVISLRKKLHASEQEKAELRKSIKELENQLEESVKARQYSVNQYVRRQSLDSVASDGDEFFDVDTDFEDEVEVQQDKEEGPDFHQFDILVEGGGDEIKKALELLLIYEHSHGSDFRFLCSLAKAAVTNAPLYSNQEPQLSRKKLLIQMAVNAGRRALSLNPDSSEAHKWYAAAVGSRTEFLGFTEKLSNGQEFKKHVDRALELDANDYFTNFLKGRMLYEISTLTWIERKAAARLLSPIPADCRAEALKHFRLTEKNCPKPWKENFYYLMQCYLSAGDSENVLRCAEIGSQIPAISQEDKKIDPEFRKILTQYSGSS